MNERLKSRPLVKRRRRSTALRVLKELMKNPLSAVCLLFVVFLVLVIIFADRIVPYELGIKMNGSARLLKPCAEHIFGCDNLGRDMFSRMVHGTRNSLSMGIGVTAVVMVAGTVLGAICAYYGGVLDMVIMRICDLLLAFPQMVLAIAVAGIRLSSITTASSILTICFIPLCFIASSSLWSFFLIANCFLGRFFDSACSSAQNDVRRQIVSLCLKLLRLLHGSLL